MNSRKIFIELKKNPMMVMSSLYEYTLWGTSFDPDPRLRNKFTSLQGKTQVLNDSVVYKYGKAPHIVTLTIGSDKSQEQRNGQQTPSITSPYRRCFCCGGPKKCCNIVLQRYQSYQVKYVIIFLVYSIQGHLRLYCNISMPLLDKKQKPFKNICL